MWRERQMETNGQRAREKKGGREGQRKWEGGDMRNEGLVAAEVIGPSPQPLPQFLRDPNLLARPGIWALSRDDKGLARDSPLCTGNNGHLQAGP
jgi:hypothetical protein